MEKKSCLATVMGLLIMCSLAQAAPESIDLKHRINIDITSYLGDNQTYTEGDIISFYLSLDRDAYVLVIYQDAAGNLTQVIPNKLSSNNFFEAGDFLSVPNTNSPFKFIVSAPFGTEYLWAFANDTSFPALEGTRLENGFIVLNDSLKQIRKSLRSFGKKSNGYFGYANTSITTIASAHKLNSKLLNQP